MDRKYTFTFFLMVLIFASCKAQNQYQSLFDKFIRESMQQVTEVPGISVAVVKGEEVLYLGAYGIADREKNLQSKTNSSYYIASTTKSFMGMLSVILEDEGKLDLEAPLTNYKPFKDLKNKELYQNITITNLLNHTSGIENGHLTFRDAYTGDKPLSDKIMLLEETSQKRKEGQTFQYDNLGYNILDVLLEAELGLNWRDLLDSRLFSPLQMNRTSAYISEAEENNWELAMPYMSVKDGEATRAYLMKDDGMMQAAGGLITTAEDVANWLLFNINEGKLNGKQVYPKELVRRSHKPLVEYERKGQIFTEQGYSLGWHDADFRGEDVRYHFGGYTGFFTHISFMPKHKIGIAIMANESYVGDNISNIIATYIYDQLLGLEPEESYQERINGVKETARKVHESIQGDIAKRADRKWQLSQPKEAYIGVYDNKHLGTIEVKINNGEPELFFGSMHAIATPFAESEKDAMRVAFVPYRGGGIWFKVEDGKVVSANYMGEEFKKVK